MRNEGIIGLYRVYSIILFKAYGATIGSFGPFSAMYFLFYEKLKGIYYYIY